MHHSITAEFSLNTPLFSSGADPNSPELRVSEIKAALRFWWRAMNYGLYVSNPARFVDVESQLFGSANASHGQGVLVSLVPVTAALKKNYVGEVHTHFDQVPGARYLGFGLMEFAHAKENPERHKPEKFRGQLLRACIDPAWSFAVKFTWRDSASRERSQEAHRMTRVGIALPDEEFQKNLVQALQAFGLFGGLGSRSRRGFGSITLLTLTAETEPIWTVPVSSDALKLAVQALLHDQHQIAVANPNDVEFSAFTSHSRVTVVGMNNPANANCYQVLDAMGSAFVRYRAWGHKGKHATQHKILNHEKALQIFVADHNWYKTKPVNHLAPMPFSHPERIVFGLPHPYDQKIWGGDDIRRASPLLFHVHRATPTLYLGLMFDLRSKFLSNGTTLKDPINGGTGPVLPDWTLLDDVLDGEVTLEDPPGVQEQRALFTNAVCTKVF